MAKKKDTKKKQKATRFFADTTVVYYKLHSHTLSQKATAEAIGNTPVVTSTFVRGEYIRGYICGLINLYCVIKGENSVDDGIYRFAAEMGRQPRKLQAALTLVCTQIKDHIDWVNIDKTLRRLGEKIRLALMKFDAHFINLVTDPLRCHHGFHNFRQQTFSKDHILDFYSDVEKARDRPTCNQCDFKQKQLELLTTSRIDLFSEGQRQKYADRSGYVGQAKYLEMATKSKKAEPTCWYCDRLSDTIIAISSPKDATILTGDANSFPALGEILGKEVRIIPSLPQLIDERDEQPPE